MAAVVNEEVVEAEVSVEVAEIGVQETTDPTPKIKLKPLGEHPSTKGRSIRIFRLAIGPDVVCISDGGVPPSFVPNPPPARGRIFLLRSNETVTSSVNMT